MDCLQLPLSSMETLPPFHGRLRFASHQGAASLGGQNLVTLFLVKILVIAIKPLVVSIRKKLLVQWDYLPHSWQIGIFSNVLTKKRRKCQPQVGWEIPVLFPETVCRPRHSCWVTNQETDLRLWCACTGISGLVDKGQGNVKGKPDLYKFIDSCSCTISKKGCAACPQKFHEILYVRSIRFARRIDNIFLKQ